MVECGDLCADHLLDFRRLIAELSMNFQRELAVTFPQCKLCVVVISMANPTVQDIESSFQQIQNHICDFLANVTNQQYREDKWQYDKGTHRAKIEQKSPHSSYLIVLTCNACRNWRRYHSNLGT
jgi:hypothetical protein